MAIFCGINAYFGNGSQFLHYWGKSSLSSLFEPESVFYSGHFISWEIYVVNDMYCAPFGNFDFAQ